MAYAIARPVQLILLDEDHPRGLQGSLQRPNCLVRIRVLRCQPSLASAAWRAQYLRALLAELG